MLSNKYVCLATAEYMMSIRPVKYTLAHLLLLLFFIGSYYFVAYSLLVRAPIVCGVVVSLYFVLYSIAIMSLFSHLLHKWRYRPALKSNLDLLCPIAPRGVGAVLVFLRKPIATSDFQGGVQTPWPPPLWISPMCVGP